MTTSLLKKISWSTLFIVAVAFVVFYSKHRPTLLAEGDTLDKKSTQNFSINLGGAKKTISVAKYNSSSMTNVKYLVSERGFFSNKQIIIEDFGQDIALCPTPVLKMKDGKEAFCLISSTGVHGQSMVLIEEGDQDLSLVKSFADGQKVTVFSDVPNFVFDDYNKDGYVDILADIRDYDKDPLQDYIRYYYTNSSNGFVLDQKK